MRWWPRMEANVNEVALLIALVVVAIGVVVVSVVYRVQEVREEAAAWDAVIARVRQGGSS